MQPPTSAAGEHTADRTWRITLAAADHADRLAGAAEPAAFTWDDASARLRGVTIGHPDAIVIWQPGSGWSACLPAGDPPALLDLLPADLQRDGGET